MLKSYELRARRAVEKLSQDEFAKKLGISRERLIAIEREDNMTVDDKIEATYNKLYPKRLLNITFKRGVGCTNCGESRLELLNDPEDELEKIYRCKDCGCVFTVGQSFGLRYQRNEK